MTAPVTLVTGLPGNGKTLYTICMLKEWAEKENRQVYSHGVEILDKQALPWLEFDPLKWHELPDGALILIDEAHKTFPVRPVGSKVPPHVEAIAELRHKGHNLVLITQHPMELDASVRRRVGRHLHCVRRFGMQACAIREWPRVVENCDKTSNGTTAQHEWVYNKAAYAWYKSAEIHTIKRKLPAKLLWLVAALLMVPIAGVVLFRLYVHLHSGEAIQRAAGAPSAASSPAEARPSGADGSRLPMSPADYARQYQPRIQGLDYTAPVYDKVTAPVRAPYPAACVASRARCGCYSQQATRLDVPDDLCRRIVAGGFFMAWDEKKQVLEAVPLAPAAQPSVPPPPSDGYISIGASSAPQQFAAADVQPVRGGRPARGPAP